MNEGVTMTYEDHLQAMASAGDVLCAAREAYEAAERALDEARGAFSQAERDFKAFTWEQVTALRQVKP
jgi:hypothetical protein